MVNNDILKYASKNEIIDIIKKYRKEKNEEKKSELLNIIFINNENFIRKITNKFVPLYGNYEDAFQQACLGFFDAVEKFDENRENAFTTYLYYWVCKSLLCESKRSIVKIPNNVQYMMSVYNKYKQIIDNNEQKYNKKFLNNKVFKNEYFINNFLKKENPITNINPIDINGSIYMDSHTKYCDIIKDEKISIEDEVLNRISSEEIKSVIDEKLDGFEKKVIYMRYFENDKCTYKDVSQKIGKTIERVRQIENKALGKLKRSMEKFHEN
jgi:RNA polymerase primary sigma factor